MKQLKLFHALAAAAVLMLPPMSPRVDRVAEGRDDTRMEAITRGARGASENLVPRNVLVAIDSETGQVYRYELSDMS